MDISTDILQIDENIPEVKVRKRRSSVVVMEMKKQLKKDLRFVSLLCSKSISSNRPVSAVEAQRPLGKTMQIAEAQQNFGCLTPFQNQALRTIQTPMRLKSAGLSSPSNFSKSMKIKEEKRVRIMTPNNKTRKVRKRIFRICENNRAYTVNITPKMRQRRMNSDCGNFNIFDTREILNIANGVLG